MKQALEDYAASTGKSWRTVLQALGIAERLLLIPQSGTLTLALPENQDTGTTLELYEKPLAGVHCRILSEANIARLGETPPPWKITTSVDVKSNALPVVCPLDTLAPPSSSGAMLSNMARMTAGMPAITMTFSTRKPGARLIGLSTRVAPSGVCAMRRRASFSSRPEPS